MTSRRLDLRRFREDEPVLVPAIGGLDLLSDFTQVSPGTLQACMNHEVDIDVGYKQADGLFEYTGRSEQAYTKWYEAIPITNVRFFMEHSSTSAPDYIDLDNDLEFTKVDASWTEDADTAAPDHPSTSIQNNSAYAYYFDAPDLKVRFWDFSEEETSTFTMGTGGTNLELSRSVGITSNGNAISAMSGDVLVYSSAGVEVDSADMGPAAGLSIVLTPVGNLTYVLKVEDDSGNAKISYYKYNADTNSGSVILSADTPFTFAELDDANLSIQASLEEDVFYFFKSDESVVKYNLATNTIINTYDLSTGNIVPESAVVNNTDVINTDGREFLCLFFDSGEPDILDNDYKLVVIDTPDTGTYSVLVEDSLSPQEADTDQAPGFAVFNNGYIVWEPNTQFVPPGVDIDTFRFEAFRWNPATEEFDVTDNSFTNQFGVSGSESTVVGYINQLNVSDLEAGGVYDVSTTSEGDVVGKIKVLTSSDEKLRYSVVEGDCKELSGDGTATNLFVRTNASTPSSEIEFSLSSPTNYGTVEDYQTSLLDINTSLTSGNAIPGTGAVIMQFHHRNQIFVARDQGSFSYMYKAEDPQDLSSAPSWEKVHLGHEVEFENGEFSPITYYDRVFLSEAIEAADNDIDKLGSSAQVTDFPNATNITNSAWASAFNVLDPSTTTESTTRVSTTNPGNTTGMITRTLRVTGFNLGQNQPNITKSRVAGIEVEINWEASTNGSSAKIDHITLLNVEGSDNKAPATVLTPNPNPVATTATIGGSTDTWNATNPSIERILSDDFGIALRFEGRRTSTAGDVDIAVRFIKLSVYYETGSETVYFWDGASDVAEGQLTNAYVSDGSYDDDDAEGILTVHELDNPDDIDIGDEIRSAASGGGDLIGVVKAEAEEVTLPSWSDMEAENSLAKVIETNFFFDEDRRAIYGVTGASPAFVFDGERFRYIRTGIDPESKDIPRDVYNHEEHLVLAYKSGSILVSVIGDPLDYNGVNGASEWGFGNLLTGLIPLNGNALGVTTDETIHALIGNNVTNFTTQTVSSNVGALEYTQANMGRTIYCDANGIADVNASANYGDFVWGRLSQLISPWLIPELNIKGACNRKPVGALSSRAKSQYRLFFDDGLILTMTLNGVSQPAPMFTFQNFNWTEDSTEQFKNKYAPTSLYSGVTDSGNEIVMIGTAEGKLFILNQLPGVYSREGYTSYDCTLTFNPFNANMPDIISSYKEIVMYAETPGYSAFDTSAGTNYLAPIPNADKDSVNIGDLQNEAKPNLIPGRISTYLPSITDGFSLKVDSSTTTLPAYALKSLTLRVRPLGNETRGNRAP